MPTLEVDVRMLSDWHVGSGAGGPGGVDAAVRRDSRGLPYVPAKTLTGMWRDAAELIAAALDATDTTPSSGWTDLCLCLFGAADGSPQPRAALATIGPAEVPLPLAARLAAGPGLTSALVGTRAHTAVNSATGTAAHNALRFVEVVDARLPLRADLTIEQHAWAHDASRLLLFAALQSVEHLGGKRRRGLGRCEIRVPSFNELAGLVEALQRGAISPLGLPEVASSHAAAFGSPATTSPWSRYLLRVTTTLPFLAARRRTGNLTESFDRIPGALLLPVLTGVLPASVGSAITDGDLLVGDAVIDVVEAAETPSIPAPRSLHLDKHDPEFHSVRISHLTDPDESLAPRRRLTGQWIQPVGDHYAIGSPETAVAAHAVVDDALQRPTEEGGGLYTYAALAAGQTFTSEVFARGAAAELIAGARVGGEHRMGRSRKDDYGRVQISLESAELADRQPVAAGVPVVVFCASDVILLDDRLRPAPTPERLAAEVAACLGVRCRLGGFVAGPDWETAVERRDTWHSKWGLPRPSIVAMSAGSTIVVTFEDEVTAEAVRQLETTGVGERRAEGFGRIVVGHRLFDEPPRLVEATPSRRGVLPTLDADLLAPFETFLEAAWRKWIVGTAASAPWASVAGRPPERPFARGPGRAQLGNLRAVLTSSSDSQLGAELRRWLARVDSNPRRKEAWGPATAFVRRLLVPESRGEEDRLRQDYFSVPPAELTVGPADPEELWRALRPVAARTVGLAFIKQHSREAAGE